MGRMTPFLIGAALAFAGMPATAQNDPAALANTAAVNATDARVGSNDMSTAATVALPPNDSGGVDTALGQPAPEEHHGFPWGVLGVVGLLGLIPRFRAKR